ncbi:outer membrane protein assembly factor BamD [Nitrospira sp. Kam-Ns4a]
MRFGWLVMCTALLVGVVAGCSNKPKPTDPNAPAARGTDEQIFIGDTIEKNYDPNVIMKRAEAFFDKEEYPEAIIEYQHFLDLHRVHTLAPYAQYKLAESHFKMFKTVDRDPEPVYKAIEHYEKLLRTYPGSRYDAEATDKIRRCHELLAQMNLMVGHFYRKKEAWLAAAHRYEYVVNVYPEMEPASEALYYLAEVYHELQIDDWARERLIALAERYPGSKFKEEGRKLLAKLAPPAAPAVDVAAGSEPGANGKGASAVARLDHLPAGAGAVVAPVSTLPNGAAAGNGIAPQVTLCRLGVRC